MKAVILTGFGGVEKLLIKEIQVPEISDTEVLVKIKAFSINPVDIKTRKGLGRAGSLKGTDPIILGWDISGIVVSKGSKVTSFKKGDEVFGMVNFPGHGKAYAEYVSAPESHLSVKPGNISHEEAAAASLAALTSWQILKGKAGIIPNDKVLIHAAAGGVGHYAVQMAKYLGAVVTGTASGANRDFVKSLGADECVDYERNLFEVVLHDMDFVLDTIGGEYIDRSLKVLRKGGTLICIPSGGAEGLEEKAAAMGLTGSRFLVQSDGEDMKEISALLEKGFIKSHVSKVFTIDQIREAHLQIESGKTRGKIVVSI